MLSHANIDGNLFWMKLCSAGLLLMLIAADPANVIVTHADPRPATPQKKWYR